MYYKVKNIDLVSFWCIEVLILLYINIVILYMQYDNNCSILKLRSIMIMFNYYNKIFKREDERVRDGDVYVEF